MRLQVLVGEPILGLPPDAGNTPAGPHVDGQAGAGWC